MVVGIIASSGGAVFAVARRLYLSCGSELDARVVTDRPCDIERLCEELDIPHRRIGDASAQGFSAKAAEWLYQERVDWICLFFTRLVTKELFDVIPCVNVHPSLLPAFRGLGALQQALDSGVRFLGATAHTVDATTDSGPVLVQVVAPLPAGASLQTLRRISFAQKLYVFLVLLEALGDVSARGPDAVRRVMRTEASWAPGRLWASPGLRSARLESAFWGFVASEGIEWQR